MGFFKVTTVCSAQRVSKMFSVLLILIICSRASCKFIQGEKTRHCENEVSFGGMESQTVEHMLTASSGNKVLYTFEANKTRGHVHLCITIMGSDETSIRSKVKPNEVFIYLSTTNVLYIVAYVTSSMEFIPKHSLKEVDEIHVCNFLANDYVEGSGSYSQFSISYISSNEAVEIEDFNEQLCAKHVEENQGTPIKLMLNEYHEVVIRFEFCVLSNSAKLTVVEEEDGNLSQEITYRYRCSQLEYSAPSYACVYELLWICYSTCTVTFQIIQGEVNMKSITVSTILNSSEETSSAIPKTTVKETSRVPSTSMGETTSHLSASSTRMTEAISQAPSTRTEETTSQAPSTKTEDIFQTTTELDLASDKLNTTKGTISDGTSTVFQTSSEMQSRGFEYTNAVFGGSILLIVVLILTLGFFLFKIRRKLSKKDNKNSVKTGQLSSSARENVNVPAHENAQELRCFSELENPEDVYNPAYESSDNVVKSDRKNFGDHRNLWKNTSPSPAPDVREEIYNPAYETSAKVKGTTHLYHYVEYGTKDCQIKAKHLPGESHYHYVDFKGN